MGAIEHPPIVSLAPWGIPDHVFYTWVVMGILVVLSLVASRNLQMVPRGTQNFMEIVLEQFITLLDEGLELAYGMHLANNVVSGLLVTSPNSVIQPHTVFMVSDEAPGAEIVAWLVMALIAFAAYYYRYRWKN